MCMSSDPDPQIGAAAMVQAQSQAIMGMQQAQLAGRQLDANERLAADYMGILRENAPTERRVQEAQAGLMEQSLDRYRNVQVPLEDQIISEARNYDSADRITAEAGKADSAVVQAYDKANAGAARDLLRSGLNPNSAKALALRENASLSQAATAANAATTTAEAVKGKGFAMRMDAAGLGRNLPTIAGQAGGAAIGAGQATTAGMGGLITATNQGYSGAQQGLGAAASTFGNASRTLSDIGQQQQAAADSNNRGIGQLAGTLGSAALSAGALTT